MTRFAGDRRYVVRMTEIHRTHPCGRRMPQTGRRFWTSSPRRSWTIRIVCWLFPAVGLDAVVSRRTSTATCWIIPPPRRTWSAVARVPRYGWRWPRARPPGGTSGRARGGPGLDLRRERRAVADSRARHWPQRHPRREPHLYLSCMGVVGGRQGAGLGSAMLRHRLERADADGLAAYLEASSPRSRALYLRHGFEDLGRTGPRGGQPAPVADVAPTAPLTANSHHQSNRQPSKGEPR